MTVSPEQLEIKKYKLARKLEEQKWNYRKAELEFLEAGQHLRALNQIMWQVPGMAIAVTGGLWYGTTLIDAAIPRIGILAFAAIVDGFTVWIIWRLRGVIEKQIKIQRCFAGDIGPKRERDRVVVLCWTIMLVVAGLLSLAGMLFAADLTKKLPLAPSPTQCRLENTVTVEASEMRDAVTVVRPILRHRQASKKQCP
ncbi:hypothetical protein [Paraburkholderia hospita]|uniref:hypothetical protein n=1 Tax=Paraburkholderia hospita TaxID=169430 RepID=UPI003ED12A69